VQENGLELETVKWDETGFDALNLHNCRVLGVAFFPESIEFAMDLDFIVKSMHPARGKNTIASGFLPPLWSFGNCHGIAVDLETDSIVEIDELKRESPGLTRHGKVTGEETEWSWTIVCQGGAIRLWASGF